MYGPGGVGKSELASNLKAVGIRPLFLDIGSGTGFLDVDRIGPEDGLSGWADLRAVLHDESIWRDFGAVVIDDLTTAEKWALDWTLENVPAERAGGNNIRVTSIEGYGFGKGYVYLFETFLQLLGDLDAHNRAGRHVVCIAHDDTARVPNPAGQDYIRYEPRLQNSKSGNVRARVKEWADHLFFIGYDIFAKDGKATGAGTRTIYPCEMPTHLAKSRSLDTPIVYERGSADLWAKLLNIGGTNAGSR